MAHAGLRDRSQRTKVRKIDHFLVFTVTWYLKLAYQSKFPGLPILQFLIAPIASCAGSLQIGQTLTITVRGLHCTDVRKTVADLAQTDEAFWSEILKRLIKITLMLAKNCLAFRGHTEDIDDMYVMATSCPR